MDKGNIYGDIELQRFVLSRMGINPDVATSALTAVYLGRKTLVDRSQMAGIITIGRAVEYLIQEGEFPPGVTRRRWREMLSILRTETQRHQPVSEENSDESTSPEYS